MATGNISDFMLMQRMKNTWERGKTERDVFHHDGKYWTGGGGLIETSLRDAYKKYGQSHPHLFEDPVFNDLKNGDALGTLRKMTVEHGAPIFYQKYFVSRGFDKLPLELQHNVFDMSVNSGEGGAEKILRRMLDAKGYSTGDIIADSKAFVEKEGMQAANNAFYETRMDYYQSLSDWGTYGRGWQRRASGFKMDLSAENYARRGFKVEGGKVLLPDKVKGDDGKDYVNVNGTKIEWSEWYWNNVLRKGTNGGQEYEKFAAASEAFKNKHAANQSKSEIIQQLLDTTKTPEQIKELIGKLTGAEAVGAHSAIDFFRHRLGISETDFSESYEAEQGYLPDLSTLPEGERKAEAERREQQVKDGKYLKIGDRYIDLEQAKAGEATQKLLGTVKGKLAELKEKDPSQYESLVKEFAQSTQQAARERRQQQDEQHVRDQSVANGLNGMDPTDFMFAMALLMMLGMSWDDAARLLGVNGQGAVTSPPPVGRGHDRGQGVPQAPPEDRDAYRRRRLDQQTVRTGFETNTDITQNSGARDRAPFGSGIPEGTPIIPNVTHSLPFDTKGPEWQQFLMPRGQTGSGILIIASKTTGKMLYSAEVPVKIVDGKTVVDVEKTDATDLRAYRHALAFALGNEGSPPGTPIETVINTGYQRLGEIAKVDPNNPGALSGIAGFNGLPKATVLLSDELSKWDAYRTQAKLPDGIGFDPNRAFTAVLDNKGRLLSGNNPFVAGTPMSTTKAATLLTLADMEKKGELPPGFLRSHAGQIDAMMQNSSNNTPEVLARAAERAYRGSEPNFSFISRMNKMAEERIKPVVEAYGQTFQTRFQTPTGLNIGGAPHRSSAFEMAQVAFQLRRDHGEVASRFFAMQPGHTGYSVYQEARQQGLVMGKTGTGFGNEGRNDRGDGANRAFIGVTENGNAIGMLEATDGERAGTVLQLTQLAQSGKEAPVNTPPPPSPESNQPTPVLGVIGPTLDGQSWQANAQTMLASREQELLARTRQQLQQSPQVTGVSAQPPIVPESVIQQAKANGQRYILTSTPDEIGDNRFKGQMGIYDVEQRTYVRRWAVSGGGKGLTEDQFNGTTPFISQNDAVTSGSDHQYIRAQDTARILPNHQGTYNGSIINFGHSIRLYTSGQNDHTFPRRQLLTILAHRVLGQEGRTSGCQEGNGVIDAVDFLRQQNITTLSFYQFDKDIPRELTADARAKMEAEAAARAKAIEDARAAADVNTSQEPEKTNNPYSLADPVSIESLGPKLAFLKSFTLDGIKLNDKEDDLITLQEAHDFTTKLLAKDKEHKDTRKAGDSPLQRFKTEMEKAGVTLTDDKGELADLDKDGARDGKDLHHALKKAAEKKKQEQPARAQ